MGSILQHSTILLHQTHKCHGKVLLTFVLGYRGMRTGEVSLVIITISLLTFELRDYIYSTFFI